MTNKAGRFDEYGGQYVPETLMNELNRMADEYEKAKQDPEFQAELQDLLYYYANRQSVLS